MNSKNSQLSKWNDFNESAHSHEKTLCGTERGLDIVVAVTQKSINHTMEEYFYLNEMQEKEFYIVNEKIKGEDYPDDPDDFEVEEKQMNYEQFMERVEEVTEKIEKFNDKHPDKAIETYKPGTFDVFAINAAKRNELSKRDLKYLQRIDLVVAFKVKLGVPDELFNGGEPLNFVELGSSSESVKFNLHFSEFKFAGPSYSGSVFNEWVNIHQDSDHLITYSSKVNLSIKQLEERIDDLIKKLTKKDGTLNKEAQKIIDDRKKALTQIKNYEGNDAFNIQQLLLDLNSAVLTSKPDLDGVSGYSDLNSKMKNLWEAYIGEMQKQGEPIFSHFVHSKNSNSPEATLEPTNLDFFVGQYLDSNGNPSTNEEVQKYSTLSYLMPTAPRKRLSNIGKGFNWNWIESTEKHDGVIAINRDVISSFYMDTLVEKLKSCCYHVDLDVKREGVFGYTYYYYIKNGKTPQSYYNYKDGGDENPVISLRYKTDPNPSAQTSTSFTHPTAKKISGEHYVHLDVYSKGKTLTIKTHVYFKLTVNDKSSDIVDHYVTDVYNLKIGAHGELIFEHDKSASSDKDYGHGLEEEGWFGKLFSDGSTDILNDFKKGISKFVNNKIKPIKISDLGDFVFPGGRTFTFTDVHFSDHGDLLAYINYVTPMD